MLPLELVPVMGEKNAFFNGKKQGGREGQKRAFCSVNRTDVGGQLKNGAMQGGVIG